MSDRDLARLMEEAAAVIEGQDIGHEARVELVKELLYEALRLRNKEQP